RRQLPPAVQRPRQGGALHAARRGVGLRLVRRARHRGVRLPRRGRAPLRGRRARPPRALQHGPAPLRGEPGVIATCRLQLHAGFGLVDAAGVLDVLEALGIDTVYTSPTFAAVPGSQHGYDVIDHRRVNPERRGEEGHELLSRALAERGMRRVVDLVPNHMAISPLNRRWVDVLDNGRSSRYAHWFDVDWSAASVERILLPVLGEPYGRVLEQRQLVLSRDGGAFLVSYYEHQAPIDPGSLGGLLDL